ncbi:MAG: hypothetical protein H0V79_13060 [Actinobacteria bacterium]|nr:hypothetical protein [Actinomycetota bacterium]
MSDPELETLRQVHEELARRVAEERLAFSDRVQEVLDHSQHLQAELDDRIEQVRGLTAEVEALRRLTTDVEALRARVESLHEELKEAHRQHQALEASRSFRYTAPLRRLGGAIRRR